jgi:ribosome maturation factor RimP
MAKDVTDQIRILIESGNWEKDLCLIDIKKNLNRISVFIDSKDGISISDCAMVHKFLNKSFEETDILDNYNLEISSPGLDMPFVVPMQYEKRIGSSVKIVTQTGSVHEGIMTNFDGNKVTLKEEKIVKEKGKKIKRSEEFLFSLAEIKETRLIIS